MVVLVLVLFENCPTIGQNWFSFICNFSFLISWGDYPFALILLNDREKFTVPLGLATYITEFNIWWNQLAVATLITLIPVLIFVGFAHQHVRSGILAGAIKG